MQSSIALKVVCVAVPVCLQVCTQSMQAMLQAEVCVSYVCFRMWGRLSARIQPTITDRGYHNMPALTRVDIPGCVGHEAFQVSVLKFKLYVGGARIPVEMH